MITLRYAKVDGKVRVYNQDGAEIGEVILDGKDDVILEGKFESVTIEASNTTLVARGADIKAITVTGETAKISADKNSTLDKVTVNAKDAKIEGEGKVKEVAANANNTKVETKGTKVEVAKDTTGTTVGGKEVKAGETTTAPVQEPPRVGGSSSPSTVAVSAISVNKTATVLLLDTTETLTATVSPRNASNKNVTWKSSDEAVATVDVNGVVTPVAKGEATITATSASDGSKTSTTEVIVSDKKVVNTTKNYEGYDTIVEAINAAEEGNTIKVAEGTYTEAIEINKSNLTLKAVGDAIIEKPESTTDHEKPGIAILANMDEITVEGFKVKGFRNGINQGRLQSEGTNVHVINNEVWPETIPNNGYMKNGIQVTGNGSTVTGNTLHGAPLTEGWDSTAIHVVNANDVLVENNTVTGPADIGIGVLNYNKGEPISGITIKNNNVNGSRNGIRVNGNIQTDVVENITVQDNTLDAGEVGTYGVNIQKITFKDSVFTDNTFTDFEYDIRISSTSATVENVKDNEDFIVLPTGVTIEWDSGEENPKIGDLLTAKLQPEGAKGKSYKWRYSSSGWQVAQDGPSHTFTPEIANNFYYVVAYDQYGRNYVSSKTDTSSYIKVVKQDGPVAPTVVGTATAADNEILVVGGEGKITVTIGTNMNGAYEYSVNNGADWADLVVEITGLTSATTEIQIREKATATTEAGTPATQSVTVTDK